MNAIVDSANAPLGLTLSRVPDGMGPSDQTSFLAKKIPSLHFFTNLHDQYHKATDDAPTINAAGIARVVLLAERVVRQVDSRQARLTFNQPPAPVRTAGARQNTGVYLGSIPDMAAPDIKGMRLTGVRTGSPADSAGLKAGDIIVEFGGVEVTDIQTYSDALYSRRPGDEVDVVVLRGTERVKLRVRLGSR
jgi:S1-C subfamily serine protease